MAWLVVKISVVTQATSGYEFATKLVLTRMALQPADVATWHLLAAWTIAKGRLRPTADGRLNARLSARTVQRFMLHHTAWFAAAQVAEVFTSVDSACKRLSTDQQA
mmetsp:Transcript_15626/g.28395  ORF Transcript_15626/g.28395 Transcript_15626/m.28395 type:complete len:106 (+) Transcript_15626:1222-1539(+)